MKKRKKELKYSVVRKEDNQVMGHFTMRYIRKNFNSLGYVVKSNKEESYGD